MLNQNTFLLLFVVLFSSCADNKKIQTTTTSNTTEVTKDTDSLIAPNLSLIDYPDAFLIENGIDDWEGLQNLHKSMERIKELNFDGIEVDLIALNSTVKDLRSGPMPRKLEYPQIKSRLKVVEMQVQKTRYFTKHFKTDSLIPALNLLYEYYNGFISRMISLQNEDQDFETDSQIEN